MRATLLVLAFSVVLVACGGGGGGESAPPPSSPPVDSQPGLTDTTVYSSAADASRPGAVEAAAVSTKTLTANGHTLSYTATAGHLIARDAAGAARRHA
ncbi:MAG: hypothetical protein ACT6S0_19015 [Roseateles sp.]|uniref:hypothetical protein n=1 Tax=Roseateles sp. TaxID=1971397 RepID=UPI00403533FF